MHIDAAMIASAIVERLLAGRVWFASSPNRPPDSTIAPLHKLSGLGAGPS